MIITVDGIKVTLDNKTLAFEEDNNVATITTNIVDAPQGDYSYKLDLIYADGKTNILDLGVENGSGTISVSKDIVPVNGKCSAQIRRVENVDDGTVMHTEIFQFWIKRSLNVTEIYDPLPSEFLEFEDRFNELANHPPKPNNDGTFWMLWNVKTHQYEESDIPIPQLTTKVTSVNGKTGDVVLNYEDVGADEAGSAQGVQDNLDEHIGDTNNPHSVTQAQVGLGNVNNTSDLDKPISRATQAALSQKASNEDLISHVEDKTNPHGVTKSQVGLGNVDNTSDIDKPISTATQGALDLKADESDLMTHIEDMENPHEVTKAQVGLGNVDNTSDMAKPISNATQAALDSKADSEDLTSHIDNTNNPHSVTKAQVGLGNVENVRQYSANNEPPYPVTKVNNKTGNVELTYSDVGADEEGSADLVQENVNTLVTELENGTKIVAKATGDSQGNTIINTYATKQELANIKTVQILNVDAEAINATQATIQTVATNYIVAHYDRQPKTYDGLVLTMTDSDNDKILFMYTETSGMWINVGINSVDLSNYVSVIQQTFTESQRQQARENIGAADSETTSEHIDDTDNPHNVTKAQLGLGNVDNTSDLNKPISNATQNALDSKANESDLESHVNDQDNPHNVTKAQVGLSNVDNTSDSAKPISNATQTALNNKVDKVAGKGLSSNDYTNTEKDKLANIENGAEVNVQADWAQTNVLLDDYIKNKPTNLSSFTDDLNDVKYVAQELTSTQQAQARDNISAGTIVGETVEEIEPIDGLNADLLQGHNADYFASKEDLVPYRKTADQSKIDTLQDKRISNLYKASQGIVFDIETDSSKKYVKSVPSNNSGQYASLNKIGGKSVVKNQLVQNGNFEDLTGWTTFLASAEVNNNILTVTANSTTEYPRVYRTLTIISSHKYFISVLAKGYAGQKIDYGEYITPTLDDNNWNLLSRIISPNKNSYQFGLGLVGASAQVGDSVQFQNAKLIDLTKMFGAGNEPTTVEEAYAMGVPREYIPYNEGEVVHAEVEDVESVGKNLANPEHFYLCSNDSAGMRALNSFRRVDYNVPSSIDGYRGIAFPFHVKSGKTYTASNMVVSFDDGSSIDVLVRFGTTYENYEDCFTSDSALIKRIIGGNTFTANENENYVIVGCSWYPNKTSGTKATIVSMPQIEEGSTVTQYSPYKQFTKQIPPEIQAIEGYGWSAGNVYNEMDFVNKKFVKRVGRVDLGSLSWTYYHNSIFYCIISNMDRIGGNLLCDKYINGRAGADLINNMEFSADSGVAKSLWFRNDSYTDVALFKDAMDGVYLLYKLATPIITDISAYLTDDNYIEVENGGTLTFEQTDLELPVPSKVDYMVNVTEVV